jgi:hypothetical protein
MKLVVPDALLRDNRLTRYSYLVATLAAVLLLRRAKDSSIPREVRLRFSRASCALCIAHVLDD